jgi:hypothetical protein
MATGILPDIYDGVASEDWRRGLVVPPAGHVYGATALTEQEWAALPVGRGVEFVLTERTVHRGDQIAGAVFADRSRAHEAMAWYALMTPEAFAAAGGPLRMVVTEVPR